MNLRLNIQKGIGIGLVFFISITIPFSGAMADSCKGGAGCLDCVGPMDSHVPGTHTNMAPRGCPSAEQNSSCGFETSRNPDDYHGIVSTARSYHQAYAGIFVAGSDQGGQVLIPGEFVAQFLVPDPAGQPPIYLLNQSLIC